MNRMAFTMRTGKSCRPCIVGCLSPMISCASLAGCAQTQTPMKPPLSRDQVVHLLKSYVSPKVIAGMVRERTIDFQMTQQVESELRQAGATDELLETLRELAPKPAPTPGSLRKNPKDGLNYVWIPPATFMMGCSPGDAECHDDEKPAHEVSLSQGLWLGQTDVTAGAYKRFTQSSGKAMPPEPNFRGRALNSGWMNDAMPIVDVTWDEANDYCAWEGGRLSTEAEWEYAARAGSTEARYGPLDDIAWYADNSGRERLDGVRIWQTDQADYAKRLNENGNGMHEVAKKRANRFGLYDMLCNVFQWVNDWYDQGCYATGPSQDPPGPASGQLRVLRGGPWGGRSKVVRVSCRDRNRPGERNSAIGFRCVGT
jgi:formylglycine-generating enzyme required for sulfatase activity